MSEVKLTEAQRRMLEKAPSDWGLWSDSWRTPYRTSEPNILGPTMGVLRRRMLVEIDLVPPRWRITPAGRLALEKEGGE